MSKLKRFIDIDLDVIKTAHKLYNQKGVISIIIVPKKNKICVLCYAEYKDAIVKIIKEKNKPFKETVFRGNKIAFLVSHL